MAPALVERGNPDAIVYSQEILRPGENKTIGKTDIHSTPAGFLRTDLLHGMPMEVKALAGATKAEQPHIEVSDAGGVVCVTAVTQEDVFDWERDYTLKAKRGRRGIVFDRAPLRAQQTTVFQEEAPLAV